jgi:hypothetical protein
MSTDNVSPIRTKRVSRRRVTPIKSADPGERPIRPGVDIYDSLGQARAVADLLLTVACADELHELGAKTMIDGLGIIIAQIDYAFERARQLDAVAP